MRLTKYEHACFVVELDNSSLVVDPGDFTTDFITPKNVSAVVITHEHQDHFSLDQLNKIAEQNPDATVIGHADVVAKVDFLKTLTVTPKESVKIGPFELAFFGGTHATIHPDIPRVANLGVMINDIIYYPGDSYTLPEQPVKVLAVPVAAPWMKVSEAIDFVRKVKPERAFPTHDAVLSIEGKGLPDHLIPMLTEGMNVHYGRLEAPLDI